MTHKKNFIYCLLISAVILSVSIAPAAIADGKMKYYLMIGEPTAEVWDAVVKTGGKNMTAPGREATEALGGKIIGYYIGATEAKNYIIAAYPDSIDVSKIVYMRAAQGVMKNLQFIEIIPADNVHVIFDAIRKGQ